MRRSPSGAPVGLRSAALAPIESTSRFPSQLEVLLSRVASGLSTLADARRLRDLLSGVVMDSEINITRLCKGVIEAAHRAGNEGVSEREAYRDFAQQDVSLVQFRLFIDSMARAGLIVRFGTDTLRATLKGLAYAGIDTRAPARVSRTAAA
jgi:hypothetical protein